MNVKFRLYRHSPKHYAWICKNLPDFRPSTDKDEFIARILHPARRVGIRYDIDWLSLVWSACIDSFFGEIEIPGSNNLFRFQGVDTLGYGRLDTIEVPTLICGSLVNKIKYVRFFNSIDECFMAFIEAITPIFGSIDNVRKYASIGLVLCNILTQKGFLYQRTERYKVYCREYVNTYLVKKGYILGVENGIEG